MLFVRSPFLRRWSRLLYLILPWALQGELAHAQSSHKRTPAKPVSPTPAAATPSASPASTYVVPDPVATVDGEPIHKADLERVTGVLLASQGKTIDNLHDDEKKTVFHSVLEDMITDRLVNREAVGESVPDLDVEKRYGELRAQYRDQASFDAEIKKSGQTDGQVRQILRIQLAQQQWIEHQIAGQVTVTPEEVEKFYKEGPVEKFAAPEMVSASHILVAVRRDAAPEEALAAQQKVGDLAARLKKGESFEALAKAYSDDPNAKQTGGDLGYFSRERIMPEFADAAFKLKVGEVSPPVRTQFGFHFIKLTDRKPAHTASLSEVRDQITTYLQTEKRRAAVSSLVASLREKAKIEIFLP